MSKSTAIVVTNSTSATATSTATKNDYIRLCGPFQATSNSIFKNTFNSYPNNRVKKRATTSRYFGIYILYCSNELVTKSNCEDAFATILENHQEEKYYCSKNYYHEEEKGIFFSKQDLNLRSQLSFYIVIVSTDQESCRQNMVAMYEIIHDFKFSGVNIREGESCEKDREGQYYYNLFIQNKSGVQDFSISCHYNHNNNDNVNKAGNCDPPIPSRSSNIFLLRQLHNRNGIEKESPYQITQFTFSMKTIFEYDLFVESLRAISSITSTVGRSKTNNHQQEQYICSEKEEQGVLNCSKMAKKARKESGIIIKVQKINSTTKNLYRIIESTVVAMDERRLSSEEKIIIPLNMKKRQKSEDFEELCSDNTVSTPNINGNDSGTETANNIDFVLLDTCHGIQRNSFYFITPNEKDRLTDYMFFLMAQVKRGELTTKDLDNARRKHSALVLGYLGLRCRHCGGTERGHYFPTTSKNLQACPSMIFKHLMSCDQCPLSIKQQLKTVKARHKVQVAENGSGLQIAFFNTLWKRIRDSNFNGGDEKTRNKVFTILQNMMNLPIQKTPANNPSDDVPKATHPISEEGQAVGNLSKPSIRSSAKPSKPRVVSELTDTCQTVKEEVNIATSEKHFHFGSSIPFPVNASSIPDISRKGSGNIESLFESRQSLNDTIGMLDAVADEILNSKPYPFMPELNKKAVSSPNQIYWDKVSLKALKDLVESDEDYREMINILANLIPGENASSNS